MFCSCLEVTVDPHRTLCPEAMCSTVCHVCHNPSNSESVPKPFPVSCPMVSYVIWF